MLSCTPLVGRLSIFILSTHSIPNAVVAIEKVSIATSTCRLVDNTQKRIQLPKIQRAPSWKPSRVLLPVKVVPTEQIIQVQLQKHIYFIFFYVQVAVDDNEEEENVVGVVGCLLSKEGKCSLIIVGFLYFHHIHTESFVVSWHKALVKVVVDQLIWDFV